MRVSDFKSSLASLIDKTEALKQHLEEFATFEFIATTPGPFITGDDARLLALTSLSDFFYDDGAKDGRYTSICLGGITVDHAGAEMIRSVNEAKDHLRLAAKALLGELGASKSKAGSAKSMRKILAEIGYGRLSLRKCYRHISLLETRPKSLRFSYSSGGKSIKKVTTDDCRRFMEEQGIDSLAREIELRKLGTIQPDTQLAQVQQLAGYYKANIVFQDGSRRTMPAFMPTFYPKGDLGLMVRQTALPSTGLTKKRKARSDQKVNPEPLFPSIRVHAYR